MSAAPKPKPKLSYKAQSYPSSDKPFECSACQLYFRRLHDLKRHERLHTGERPYCCLNCRRTFARLDALKRHLGAESNVNCLDWVFTPGPMTDKPRPHPRSHQRSVSLPYVDSKDVRNGSLAPQDNAERTPTISSPKDRSTLYHIQHRQAASMSDATMSTPPRNIADDIPEQDESMSIADQHLRHLTRPTWGVVQSKRSMPQLSMERTLPPDMAMEEDAPSHYRPRPRAATLYAPMPHSPAHPLYPQSYRVAHPHAPTPPHPEYHSHQPAPSSPSRKPQPRERRESYHSSSSRSTISPSPSSSPGLSPSPSSMSTSSLSSPTNIWSISKGFEPYDATAPNRGIHSHETWTHHQRQHSSSLSQRLDGDRQERVAYQDEGSSQEQRSWESERRPPSTSLAAILNSPSSSIDNSPSFSQEEDRRSPPVLSSRPQHLHHTHSHSYSHPTPPSPFHHLQHHHPHPHHSHHHLQHPHQQPHHSHSYQQHSPPGGHKPEHICEAVVEMNRLREELEWVKMRYHSLSEKSPPSSSSSSSSNNAIPSNIDSKSSTGQARGDIYNQRSGTLV